jgi:hypothetical protein
MNRDHKELQYNYNIKVELQINNTITINKYNDRWCLNFIAYVYDFVVDNFDRIVMTLFAFINFVISLCSILYSMKNK